MRKKFQKIPKDKIIEAINSSVTFRQVLEKLKDFISDGPQNRKSLKEFIELNCVDTSHFDKKWFHRKRTKYVEIKKTCPKCGKEYACLSGGKKYKDTCSRECSNYFFADKRMTQETKEKISQGVNKYWNNHPEKLKNTKNIVRKKYKVNENSYIIHEKICQACNEEFSTNKRHRKTCSYECSRSHTKNPEYRKKLSDIQQKKIENGTHQGWKTRNISSYAEKYFQFKLDEENIPYEFNFPISKKSLGFNCAACYFLDFYFNGLNLNLEIDGKQHKYAERIISDRTRDNALSKNGITTFRIKWKNPVNTENKEYLSNCFDEFLTLYYKILAEKTL